MLNLTSATTAARAKYPELSALIAKAATAIEDDDYRFDGVTFEIGGHQVSRTECDCASQVSGWCWHLMARKLVVRAMQDAEVFGSLDEIRLAAEAYAAGARYEVVQSPDHAKFDFIVQPARGPGRSVLPAYRIDRVGERGYTVVGEWRWRDWRPPTRALKESLAAKPAADARAAAKVAEGVKRAAAREAILETVRKAVGG